MTGMPQIEELTLDFNTGFQVIGELHHDVEQVGYLALTGNTNPP